MKYFILFACLVVLTVASHGDYVKANFKKLHDTNIDQTFDNEWINYIENIVKNRIDSRQHLEGNVAEGESDAQAFGHRTKAIGNQWATVVEGEYSGAGGKAIAGTCGGSSHGCVSTPLVSSGGAV
eukprot:TRINITY_DN1379_c0_g2_i5.p2 TRINITY_DN1379_c0_g2~~TRINITY_DN1379_c0_g2_i5.p2  ORF type:complete len:125 (-),score=16.70 TRINITY_DN1379_c0_g2_i5:3-377(-)